MDITRIGGLSWNETKSSSSFKALGINTGDEDDLISQQLSVTSQLPTSPHQSAVKGFLQEISSSRQMANSVGDLLSVSRNRLGRQFVLSKVLQQSSSVPLLNTNIAVPAGTATPEPVVFFTVTASDTPLFIR